MEVPEFQCILHGRPMQKRIPEKPFHAREKIWADKGDNHTWCKGRGSHAAAHKLPRTVCMRALQHGSALQRRAVLRHYKERRLRTEHRKDAGLSNAACVHVDKFPSPSVFGPYASRTITRRSRTQSP